MLEGDFSRKRKHKLLRLEAEVHTCGQNKSSRSSHFGHLLMCTLDMVL